MGFTVREAPPPFTAKDGSRVREIAHPDWGEPANQSLAEASVPPGGTTLEHHHSRSEEVYYFLRGRGRMRLADREAEVAAGDCVVIHAGTPHKLWAHEDGPLVVLCCSSPPYSDEDTVITEDGAASEPRLP